MIRTKDYIIAKFHNREWIPVKEYGSVEAYTLRDAHEVLNDLRNGDVEGHSKKCQYKIMEICFCDLKTVIG